MSKAISTAIAVSHLIVSTNQALLTTEPKMTPRAMLDCAVAAVKQDKANALDMFNKGEGGCANAFDGIITAHLCCGQW